MEPARFYLLRPELKTPSPGLGLCRRYYSHHKDVVSQISSIRNLCNCCLVSGYYFRCERWKMCWLFQTQEQPIQSGWRKYCENTELNTTQRASAFMEETETTPRHFLLFQMSKSVSEFFLSFVFFFSQIVFTASGCLSSCMALQKYRAGCLTRRKKQIQTHLQKERRRDRNGNREHLCRQTNI